MNGFFNLNPQQLGLLGMAGSLLESSGPSVRPIGTGQAIGRSLQPGLMGYQQGLQFEDLQRKQDAEKKRLGDIENFAATLPPDQQQRFRLDPGAYLKATTPKTPEGFTLTPGAIRYGPDGKPIASAPTKPGESSQLAKLLQEQKNFPPGTPQWQIYQDAITRASTHAPAAQITNAPVITTGTKAADTKFADEYQSFVTGGFADTQKQLGQLREVAQALKTAKPGTLTGPAIGIQPRAAMAVTAPNALAALESVEEVAQRNLRMILGPQFTEKEGERLISRVYNPMLPEAENLKRVERLITQIDEAAKAKLSASQFFMKNGTLSGWKGKTWTMKDFEPEKSAPKGPQISPDTQRLLDKYAPE